MLRHKSSTHSIVVSVNSIILVTTICSPVLCLSQCPNTPHLYGFLALLLPFLQIDFPCFHSGFQTIFHLIKKFLLFTFLQFLSDLSFIHILYSSMSTYLSRLFLARVCQVGCLCNLCLFTNLLFAC